MKIENLRKKLEELTKKRDMLDPEVISLSKNLDRLLNEYVKIKKNGWGKGLR